MLPLAVPSMYTTSATPLVVVAVTCRPSVCSVTLSPSLMLVAAAAKVVYRIMSLPTRITGMMSPAAHSPSFSHMEM